MNVMMYVSEKIVSICRIIMRWLMSLLLECMHVKTNKLCCCCTAPGVTATPLPTKLPPEVTNVTG